jgi:hypothetical protein
MIKTGINLFVINTSVINEITSNIWKIIETSEARYDFCLIEVRIKYVPENILAKITKEIKMIGTKIDEGYLNKIAKTMVRTKVINER